MLSSPSRTRLLSYRLKNGLLALFLLSISAAAPALQLSAEEQAWLDSHPKIEIGINNAWPPMDYVDLEGEPRGIGVDFIRALNRRLGGRLAPVPGSWERIYNAVKQRRMAALMDITPRPDRAADFDFTSPYIRIPHVIFTRETEPPASDLAGLAGRTVGVEQGFFIVGLLRKKYPAITVREYPDTSSAIGALARGEVDAYIGNRAVANYVIHNELLSGIHATGRVSETQSINAIGVRKDWPILRDILQKALSDIGTGERTAILKAWAGGAGKTSSARKTRARLPAVQLNEHEKHWLRAHKTIRLGVDRAWPPMEFIDADGNYKGISRDYTRLFGRQLGIHWVDPKPIAWNDVLRGIREKTLDVIPLLSHTPERETYLNFTKPYINAKVVIINRRGTPSIESLSQLTGRHIAVVRGYSLTTDLKRDYPSIIQDPYDSVTEALRGVSEGRSDAFVGILSVAGYLIGKEGLSNLKVAGSTEYTKSFAMGVRKDWPELIGILNKAIDTLDDATRNRIFRHWTTVKFQKHTDYALVFQVLGGALLVLFIGSIWLGQIKRANRALTESRERLALTLKGAQLGTWEAQIPSNATPRLRLDETCREHLGIPEAPSEMPLNEFMALLDEPSQRRVGRQVQRFLEGTDTEIRLEYHTRLVDRWVYAHGHTLQQDEAGRPRFVVGITQDITERHRAHEALEQANRFKSEFLANMSHEIRTPMNAIIGLGHLLAKTPLNARQDDYVHKIQVSAQSLLGVVDDILDFSKIEAGKLNIETAPFSFEEIFESVSIMATARIGDKPVELLYDFDPAIPPRLVGDSYRINQIMTNLVSNAAKFTEQGSIVVSAHIWRRHGERIWIRFSVADTGIGIAPDRLEHLFDPFVQADGSTTRQFGGTGLGLSICRKLVGLMGGEIRAESTPGQGSCFIVDLPLQTTRESRDGLTSPNFRDLRILLMDDNPTARHVIGDMLESMHFHVSVVSSCEEALTHLQEADPPFDLALLDWRMPGMKGDRLARTIREHMGGRGPAIILMTAYGREIMDHPLDEGVLDGVLIKPLTPSLLNDAIVRAYSARRPEAFNSTVSAAPKDSGQPLSGRVLVVEDNDINQQVAVEMLRHMGVQADTVSDGALAVQAVEHNPPDLVLMDIQMPVMDGYEATRRIRHLPGMSELPIYAMTANALVGDTAKSLAAGMNGHIAKPVDPEELYQVLARHLPPGSPPQEPETAPPAGGEWRLDNPCPECLDPDRGIAQVGGNTGFYLKLLGDFLANHGNAVEHIHSLLDSGDREGARREVHTLRGVAGNIGAQPLQTQAAQLEAALLKGPAPQSLLDAFDEVAEALFAALRQILASATAPTDGAAEDGTRADEHSHRELLMLLRALQHADAGARRQYQSLGPYLHEVLPTAQAQRLQTLMEDYEFEAAAELLRAALPDLEQEYADD